MALFQEQETENIDVQQPQNKIYQDYKNEFDSIYSNKQKIIKERQENENILNQKLISPEKIQEWKNKGGMTAIDVFNKKDANELVPFMGTWKEGTKSFKLKEISDKVRNGQYVTPEERETYNKFILDMAEIQTRGMTIGGKFTNIGLETIPFMIEFGAGLLTSGGAGSVGATTSKLSTLALKKGIARQLVEGAGKTALNVVHPKTIAFSATRLPQQVRARMGDIMLSESVSVSPEGQAILKEAKDKPFTAFMKALTLTNIEVASEMSGAMLVRPLLSAGGKLGKVIASPVLKHLPEGFADKFVNLAEQVTKLPFARAVDELGFNGILEEMGEERIGDLLQFALKPLLEGEQWTFEGLLDAVFPAPEDLLAEAMSFGVTGLGMNAIDKGIKAIPKAGEKYTKDGYLIDAGIFRVAGYDSYLDRKVKEELEKKGKSEEEIDSAINFSTRDDKVQFLKDTNTQFDTKKEFDEKEAQKDLKRVEVEEKAYEKFTQGGNVKNDNAYALAKLFGAFYKNHAQGNKESEAKFDEWFDKFQVQYDVPVNGQKVMQYQGVNVAGANENEVIDAQNEWQEKGTESKYFKKWFGDSKVVDENGKPLEVYHGTENGGFNKFDSNKSNYGYISAGFNFFTNKKSAYPNSASDYAGKNGQIYETYLSIKKPLEIGYRSTPNDNYYSPVQFWDYNQSYIRREYKKGDYDGIIIYNEDKANDDSIIYLVPNSEQIKSVNNQGTFDAENPNIYYQTGIKEIDESQKYNNLPKDLKDAIDFIYNGKSVYDVTGNEFPKNGESLNDRIYQYYKEKFNNNVNIDKLGKVLLDKRSIKDSAYHGLSNNKVNAFAAVPYVLQQGKFLDVTKENGKNEKRYLFVAPITINENNNKEEYFCEVVVKSNKDRQGFYIHEVELKKKLADVFSTAQHGTSASSKSIIADLVNKYNPNVKNNEGKILFQAAYHGTPHRFDEFSLENIGSGEGAQAHGWGLYFAEDKDVSENYRRTLTGDFEGMPVIPVETIYDGKEITDANLALALEQVKNRGKEDVLLDLKSTLQALAEDLYEMNTDSEEHQETEFEYKDTEEIIDFIKNVDISKLQVAKREKAGQLFKVDIPESDVLLDEDKPFSHQPEKVQEAISKIAEDYNIEQLQIETKKHFIQRVINKYGEQAGKIVEEIYEAEIENNEYDDIETNKMVEDAWDKWNQFELDNDIDRSKDDFNINEIYKTLRKDLTGREIYKILVYYSDATGFSESQKEASLLLNKYGIKGITYDGKQDGRCYVIFDDKAVEVLKTYYQEGEEEEKRIAGFTYPEVLEKLTELYEKLGQEEDKLSEEERNSIMAKVHVLEDAFDAAENIKKFSNEDEKMNIMLNAYYVMNNQEIPEEYVDTDKKSARTYNDFVRLHREKKEKKEAEYYGYFTEGQNKNIITIMSNSNASTALHELGHLFLNGLNELANVDENARKQLEAVNKWLGFSGEYTVKQQEKFARSFEAYLYKGKAPNNSLRQVFENFKEWLKSVYEDITSIKDADISPEVQELFDNMFGGDEYYQERKEATELLKRVKNIVRKERVENIPVRDDKELDETAKRHKEIAYQILSVGTGKDIKYLKTIFETGSDKKSFAKKREAIEFLLDKVEDQITTSGGMRQEWKEFFSDTGVNYDTDEVGSDYKLVEKALDTIINKTYGYQNINNELDERAQYYEKAIDEADRQYKVLISEFRNGNRNVALAAIYEWLENIDTEIKQDYEDRFIYDSGVIERNENIDKFDRAKRQILKKALELNSSIHSHSSENEKYQETVKEIMRSLDFLQPTDKARLTANILDVPNVNFLMSSIDNIMDIAKTMEDVYLRRNLEKEIHKELQGTKNIKKNGRTVGKYDYRTNKLFEELRELDRLTPEKANELRLELSRFSTAEDNGLSFKDKLINKFLSYKAGGRTFEDTELMKELYDAIVKIKLAGKSAKSELDMMEKIDETRDIEELIKIVQGKKEANFVLKGYVNMVANLESTLNALFNKDIKDRYGAEILYAETQAQAWQHEQKQKFERKVAEIYSLPEWCWDKKIIEYLGEKHTYSEIRRKYDKEGNLLKARNVDRTLTKMDIIQAYIWSKNEVLEQRLKNQFGEETLEAMFDELSIEDVKLAETMMQLAQSFYPLVNKAFINKYGLDLPRVSCYFPSTPERGSEVDLYNDYSSKSLNNSFTKQRAQSETQAMDFHNPVATLYNHIDGVSKFIFMSESLDRANLRFKDLDLKRVIVNKFGEDAYRTLEQALMNVTYKKEAPVFNGMNKIIDNMVGNWIQANVAVKPIVGLKQLLSANNYAVDMPYMKWQAGFLKALAHPKKTIDYIMSIPYIKARYEGSFSNEFLKQTVENSAFAMSKKLKDACNMFIKMGDIGAIIFGGKPYIDYLIEEKGMSEQEAIKKFILSTNRSQQSSAISSLSNFQVAMTRNPMGKLFIAFKNSPQQYIRMCGDAIVSTANGDMTKAQCAKMLFQFGYLQPFLYAVATSGSLLRFLFTGDDDDFIKDAKISIFNFGTDALPILGDIYKYALNRIGYKEKYLPQTTPLLGDIQNEINKISKDDVTLEDYLEAIGYLGLHVGLGYNSKAFANMGSGVGDIATGKVSQGAMKVLGYTEKRSKHITGNEKKKKKK